MLSITDIIIEAENKKLQKQIHQGEEGLKPWCPPEKPEKEPEIDKFIDFY